MRLVLSIALGIIFLMVTGCTPISSTDPYDPIEPQYRGLADSRAEIDNTTDSSIPGPLTLDKAIDIALKNNPGLLAQKGDLSAARARQDIAFSQALPDLRARTSYTDYINDQPLIAIGGGDRMGQTFTDKISTAELILEMPIFTGGRIINQIRAAELLKKASEQTLARTHKELTFNVSSLFYNILSQEQVIESLKFSQEALKEQLEQVQNLINHQKATKVDRLRTEVRLANVKEQLSRAKNLLEIKNQTLTNLLGLETKPDSIKLKGELGFEQKSLPSLEESIIKAYKQRRDYQASKRRLEAAAKQVDVAIAEQWPNIAFEASIADRWNASDISKSPEDAGKLAVALNLPLFEGGRIRASIREERSKLAAVQERHRKLKLQVKLDVQTARSNVSSARERVLATRKAVNQGKESLRIEQLKHRVGESTITDVLDAQAEMLESQTNYYQALADYKTALAELDLAMGEINEEVE